MGNELNAPNTTKPSSTTQRRVRLSSSPRNSRGLRGTGFDQDDKSVGLDGRLNGRPRPSSVRMLLPISESTSCGDGVGVCGGLRWYMKNRLTVRKHELETETLLQGRLETNCKYIHPASMQSFGFPSSNYMSRGRLAAGRVAHGMFLRPTRTPRHKNLLLESALYV